MNDINNNYNYSINYIDLNKSIIELIDKQFEENKKKIMSNIYTNIKKPNNRNFIIKSDIHHHRI